METYVTKALAIHQVYQKGILHNPMIYKHEDLLGKYILFYDIYIYIYIYKAFAAFVQNLF